MRTTTTARDGSVTKHNTDRLILKRKSQGDGPLLMHFNTNTTIMSAGLKESKYLQTVGLKTRTAVGIARSADFSYFAYVLR